MADGKPARTGSECVGAATAIPGDQIRIRMFDEPTTKIGASESSYECRTEHPTSSSESSSSSLRVAAAPRPRSVSW